MRLEETETIGLGKKLFDLRKGIDERSVLGVSFEEGGRWTVSISVNRSWSVLIFVNGISGKNRIIKNYKIHFLSSYRVVK